jgi:hypothetical protein
MSSPSPLVGAALMLCAPLTFGHLGELPNRIPEAAPYNTAEAKVHRPPYDSYFSGPGSTAVCAGCHQQIFAEWNGSMMANSWRDPAWRGAFLLIARLTSRDGSCDIPNPPDGTKKAKLNPFANDDCTSTFDLGTKQHTMSGSGSLLDGFCSRCHMPANYIDSVKYENITRDPGTGLEHGLIDPDFDPSSARGTPFAFAALESKSRNSAAGRAGITCTFCHTAIESRHTPFHNYEKSGKEYTFAPGKQTRDQGLPPGLQEMLDVPDPNSRNLGYGIGAGAYRVSPEALTLFERFGPLSKQDRSNEVDSYLSEVFGKDINFQKGAFASAPHKGNYSALYRRSEMCALCHDVTNPLTIKNPEDRWVGGFPIERTYSEWVNSRYADRPGNQHYQPGFKRDCQTCHMQQDFGQPGTAHTLYDKDGKPLAPRAGKPSIVSPERPILSSHHFVGGNTLSTRLIGATVDAAGKTQPWPELSVYSYSSADEQSKYHNAYWENTSASGPPTQHLRMAWDRLRHAVSLELAAPKSAQAGSNVELHVRVQNTGAGHNFPTGFPEGRNAWVAVRAFDLASGKELEIEDSFWKRRSVGVGYLTREDMVDPSFAAKCNWVVPAGSPDPYAYQFRAVASLGNGCPTLALPYAAPLNLTVDGDGLPIDKHGRIIDRDNPLGVPQFRDLDGDGDLFDDAFLIDQRLRPMPHPQATLELDRYSVIIPPGTVGPVSVTSAVYYQSMEAAVAKKFLGNMADTDLDHVLEPCVLGGACDGRVPSVEPAVVEGSAPVPMRVVTQVIQIGNTPDVLAPAVNVYPAANATEVYDDVVVKVTASEPLIGVDETTFTLNDSDGKPVPARVAQIADFTWALFPNQIFLQPGKSYAAKIDKLCDTSNNCDKQALAWKFSVAHSHDSAKGDTRPPQRPSQAPLSEAIAAATTESEGGGRLFALLGVVIGLIGFAAVSASLSRPRAR